MVRNGRWGRTRLGRTVRGRRGVASVWGAWVVGFVGGVRGGGEFPSGQSGPVHRGDAATAGVGKGDGPHNVAIEIKTMAVER